MCGKWDDPSGRDHPWPTPVELVHSLIGEREMLLPTRSCNDPEHEAQRARNAELRQQHPEPWCCKCGELSHQCAQCPGAGADTLCQHREPVASCAHCADRQYGTPCLVCGATVNADNSGHDWKCPLGGPAWKCATCGAGPYIPCDPTKHGDRCLHADVVRRENAAGDPLGWHCQRCGVDFHVATA